MSKNELDRSVLDSKDREELHAIAGAMGVRAATRMKKADLIDAILGAGNNESGDAGSDEKPKRVRSRRASEADDPIAELAAEEEAIAAAGASGDTTAEPVPASRPATSNASSGNGGGGPPRWCGPPPAAGATSRARPRAGGGRRTRKAPPP